MFNLPKKKKKILAFKFYEYIKNNLLKKME